MTRALPADLLPIVNSRGPFVANTGLRILRWIDWGDGFGLRDAEETAYLKTVVNLFKKQSKPDSVLSQLLAAHHDRSRERAEALRSLGYAVRDVRRACAGRIRLEAGPPQPGDPGIALHRNLGIPFVPSGRVRMMLQAGAQRLGLSGDRFANRDFVVFDGLPAAVPRLESEILTALQTAAQNGTTPRVVDRNGRLPVELVSVAPSAVFEFWFAAREAELLDDAERSLSTALEAFSLAPRGDHEETPQEADATPIPVAIPVPETSGAAMVARAISVHYQVHNGRIVAVFRHATGKDVKAEEHTNNVVMTDNLRKRLAKKKVLQDIDIEVEAVGNAWRIRGIHG